MNILLLIKQTYNKRGLRYLLVKFFDYTLRPIGVNIESFLYDNKADKYIEKIATSNIDIKSRFDAIYESNYWSSNESVSGSGSEIKYARNYTKHLSKYLEKKSINKFFDAPCGDFNWVSTIAQKKNIHYIGGDIVRSLIERNRSLFPSVDFRIFDITRDEFPSADIWHCRDCLFHLSYSDIYQALENFVSSDIQLALITTHYSVFLKNRDIETGFFRYTDLRKPPFNFPEPEVYLKDFTYGKHFPRYVACWNRKQIQSVLDEWNL